jgi:predicted transcriptional regulator
MDRKKKTHLGVHLHLNDMPSEESLTPEQIRVLLEAETDYQNGRVVTHENVVKSVHVWQKK